MPKQALKKDFKKRKKNVCLNKFWMLFIVF